MKAMAAYVQIPLAMLILCFLASAYAQAPTPEAPNTTTKRMWPLREEQKQNTKWQLRPVKSRGDSHSLYCGRNMTAPGPFCNLKGAAGYLLAARFNGSQPSPDAGKDTRSTTSAWSTAANLPWIVADYVITKTTTQKAVGVSKTMYGEAQVDVFLCSDSNCNSMADIRTIVKNNTEDDEWSREAPSETMISCILWPNGPQLPEDNKTTPLRIVYFRMLGIGNLTAIPTGVIRNSSMSSFVRVVDRRSSGTGESTRFEVIWEDSVPPWRQRRNPWDRHPEAVAMMPVGVLVRFETEQEMEMSQAVTQSQGNITNGFRMLRVGLYRVSKFLSQGTTSHCAWIVMPSNLDLDSLGWNVSSGSCIEATETYIFDSYFPQSVYMDRRVKLVKTFSFPAGPALLPDFSVNYDASNMTLDPFPLITTTTVALTFVPDPWKKLLPGPLQLNESALNLYGLRLSGTVLPRPGLSNNAPWAYEYEYATHAEAGCLGPRGCVILSVGTATVVAWKVDFRIFGDLDYSNYTSLFFESVFALKHMSLYPRLSWCGEDMPASSYALILLGQTSNAHLLSPTYCPEKSCLWNYMTAEVFDCKRWAKSGLGFPHASEGNISDFGGRTLPLESLLGDVYGLEVDFPALVTPFRSSGTLLPCALEASLEEVCDGATSLLDDQLALALVNADSTRSISGALLEISVTIIAVIAIASGRKDLEEWLHGLCAKMVPGGHAPGWLLLVAKTITSLIICLSLVVAPATSLAADIRAVDNNPKGEVDDTSIGWLSSNTRTGDGPYHVVGVVTTTVWFKRDPAAYGLMIFNITAAALSALLLCLRVFKPESRTSREPQGKIDLCIEDPEDTVLLVHGSDSDDHMTALEAIATDGMSDAIAADAVSDAITADGGSDAIAADAVLADAVMADEDRNDHQDDLLDQTKLQRAGGSVQLTQVNKGPVAS